MPVKSKRLIVSSLLAATAAIAAPVTVAGPAAAVHGTVEISIGEYGTCYDVFAYYLDGHFTSTRTCP